MLRKYGKWYADWKTPDGKRHRRAFDSKKEAAEYAKEQRAAAKEGRRKKARARRSKRS